MSDKRTLDYRTTQSLKANVLDVAVAIDNSDGKLRAFGSSAYDGTNFYVTYRRGNTHFQTGDDGEAVMIKSTDAGLTWSAEQVIAAVTDRDVRDPVIFKTSTGRLLLKYFIGTVAGDPAAYTATEIYTKYSDDSGATYSVPFQFPVPTGYDAGQKIMTWGNVIESGGVIYTTAYGLVSSVAHVFLYKSIDNGATWVFVSIVNDTVSVDESSLMILGTKMSCIMRANNPSSAISATYKGYIAYSEDSGATWSPARNIPMLVQSPWLHDLGSGYHALIYRSRTKNLFTYYEEMELHAIVLKDGRVTGNVIRIDDSVADNDLGYPSIVEIGTDVYITYYAGQTGIVVKKIAKADLLASDD